MAKKTPAREFNATAANKMINAIADKPAAERGLMSGDTRFTTVIKASDLELLRDWAYTERLTMKELVAQMVALYIEEKVNMDEILARPDSKRL